MNMIRWGILSTGKIAKQFAAGLSAVPGAELVAVGSRSAETADAFGEQFHILRGHRHASYEALANDPAVDVVYIGTPHTLHAENTRLCLEAGKHVLCEKPFTINAGELEPLIQLARAKGLFLMEAMWTRFLPAWIRIREMITSGRIGEPRMLLADMAFKAAYDPEARLFNPMLGGGALLDLGIYPVSMAWWMFGAPTAIQSMAHIGATGVDEQTVIQMRFAGGQLAALGCALNCDTVRDCTIAGTGGYISASVPWWKAQRFRVFNPGPNAADQWFEVPTEGNGYNYEAIEVMRCLRAGQTESAVMPLNESLDIMRTLDTIRAQWGLKYPGEA